MQVRITRRSRSLGFTLVELMIVVVIASILLTVAVSSYMQQIRQSRRTDARTAALDAAGREERYMATNGQLYTNIPNNIGYGPVAFPVVVGSGGYYQMSVNVPAITPNPPAAPNYSVTVTPMPATSQAADNTCQKFQVDSNGMQFAYDNLGNLQTNTCWSQ
jgi:type IV pilus assembly protein PilE